jgi:hypothetical protein
MYTSFFALLSSCPPNTTCHHQEKLNKWSDSTSIQQINLQKSTQMGLTYMLNRCNQGSKNDQHWHLTAKEVLWVPWTYNFVSNTSCCMQWPWTWTMSQERFITPLLVLCVQLFTLDHRKTTKSVIINTAEDISPWHKSVLWWQHEFPMF